MGFRHAFSVSSLIQCEASGLCYQARNATWVVVDEAHIGHLVRYKRASDRRFLVSHNAAASFTGLSG